jgi:hypothetical protein
MIPGPPNPPRFSGTVPAGSPLPGAANDSGAIASLVCGVVSWFLCGLPVGIPAIFLAHGSMKKIRRSGGRLKGREIALAGAVLGYSSCAFWLAYLAVGFFFYKHAAKEAALDEDAAVEAIRQINKAETQYSLSYANASMLHIYAGSLATLGPGPQGSCAGEGTAEYACLLSGPLGASDCREPRWCQLRGYKFQLQVHFYPDRRDGDYVITAIPAGGDHGGKNFCSTSEGIIRTETRWARLIAGYNCEECLRLEPLSKAGD